MSSLPQPNQPRSDLGKRSPADAWMRARGPIARRANSGTCAERRRSTATMESGCRSTLRHPARIDVRLTTRADVHAVVQRFTQMADGDGPGVRRGMDKVAVAQIEAGMSYVPGRGVS